MHVSAHLHNVLYSDDCGRGVVSQSASDYASRRLAYDVLNAVAGDRLERRRWRRAQSTTTKLLALGILSGLLDADLVVGSGCIVCMRAASSVPSSLHGVHSLAIA